MIEAGIEYAKGPSTLTALASISDTSFNDRGVAETTLGLATEVNFHTFSLNYTRQINPNLSVTGLIGLVGVTSGFAMGLPKSAAADLYVEHVVDVYAKVDPDRDRVANSCSSDDGYRQRGDLTIPAEMISGLSGHAQGRRQRRRRHCLHQCGVYPGLAVAGLTPFFAGASGFLRRNAGLTYAMTPFLTAALNASYTERVGRPSDYPGRFGHGKPEL